MELNQYILEDFVVLSTNVAADLAAYAERLELDGRLLVSRLCSEDVPREVQADELASYGATTARVVRAAVAGPGVSEQLAREALELGDTMLGRALGITNE